MRILLVSDHYPPFIGGVQRQTRTLAMALHAQGHTVGVVTVWQDDQPAFESPDGFPVWRLRQLRTLPGIAGVPRRRYQAPGPDPVTVWQLRRVIKRFAPDLVHSSGWFTYSAAAALLRRSIPLVVSVREYGFICSNASLLHKGSSCSGPSPAKCVSCSVAYWGAPRGLVAVAAVYASKPLLRRRATAVHSVSRYVEDLVVNDVFAGRDDLIRDVIPSFRSQPDGPVDAEVLSRLPSEPFILFVGAIRAVKGVGLLLDAYERLTAPPPLVLLGTVESDAPTRIPSGVVVVGGASYATVLAAWDRCLFGVLPSLWPEPFGSVVHEAMSRRKAVIGTTPGGHEDMIDAGRSGLLVPIGDVDALRAAMERLLADPKLRDEIGAAAGDRAAVFTEAAVLPKFDALYARVLARQP